MVMSYVAIYIAMSHIYGNEPYLWEKAMYGNEACGYAYGNEACGIAYGNDQCMGMSET